MTDPIRAALDAATRHGCGCDCESCQPGCRAQVAEEIAAFLRALVGGDTPLAPEVETLRDRFAGRVLTGMMADHTAPNRPPEFFADLAYKYADAMMEARKK
jgi:hypothetical protein